MSEPDEDPPVTGGRDLPESLVWRRSKPSRLTRGSSILANGEWVEWEYDADCPSDSVCQNMGLFERTKMNEVIARQAAELAAQAEEIRRLREALGRYANEDNWGNEMGSPILWQGPNGDGMVGKGGYMLAAKAMEPQTTKPKD
jgi:hypothetical protein